MTPFLLALTALFASEPRTLFEAAMAKQQAGDLAAAEKLLAEASRLAPRSVPVLANLGAVRAQRGNIAGAVESYTRALTVAPHAHRVRLNLAIAWVRGGEFARALPEIERFREVEPNNAQASELRALCLHQTGRFAESVVDYRNLIAKQGESIQLLYGLGEALGRAGDLEGAARAFDRLFTLYPNAPQTRLLLAQKKIAEGGFDEAIQEISQLAKDLPGIHLWRGIALEKAGRKAEALAAYREEVAATGDLAARYAAGVLESRIGDPARALRLLRASLPIDGERYNVSFHLGYTYAKLGRHADALPYVEASARRHRESGPEQYLLMHIYRKLGRTADIRRQVEILRELKAAELAADEEKVRARER